MSEWLKCWNMKCDSNRETGTCKNLGVNEMDSYCLKRIEPIESSNNAVSLEDFLKQENLENMSNDELMKLWGFILSDFERLNVEYKIKKILDERNLKSNTKEEK